MHGSSDLFDAANSAYKDGNYALAIEQYQTLLSESEQEVVLYNLGNSYYKQGEYTHAILYYERALKLAPSDKDIIHNLDLARLNIVDKIEATPEFFLWTWWKSIASIKKSNGWTMLFLIGPMDKCSGISCLCIQQPQNQKTAISQRRNRRIHFCDHLINGRHSTPLRDE